MPTWIPDTSLSFGRCITGVLFATGLILAAAVFSYQVLPDLITGTMPPIGWPIGMFAVAALFVIAGLLMLLRVIRQVREDVAGDPSLQVEPNRSSRLYGEVLVGVGAALLIDAVVCSIILSGIMRAGHLLQPPVSASSQSVAVGSSTDVAGAGLGPDQESALSPPVAGQAPAPIAQPGVENPGPVPGSALVPAPAVTPPWTIRGLFGRDVQESTLLCAVLLLGALLAILGALFFFSTALWEKMERLQTAAIAAAPSGSAGVGAVDPFNDRMFWAGLWFRIGEAVTFSLVLFLVVRQFAEAHLLLLPLLALLIGMFLKAGERLITGIAQRIFAAFEQLVPARPQVEETPRVGTWTGEGIVQPDNGEPTPAAIEAVSGLLGVTGVLRTRVRRGADPAIQVEYLPSKVGRLRIEQELRWHGLNLKSEDA